MQAKKLATKAPATMAIDLSGAILLVDFGSLKMIDLQIAESDPVKKMESEIMHEAQRHMFQFRRKQQAHQIMGR
jgi:transcriptional regulatory protein LevR